MNCYAILTTPQVIGSVGTILALQYGTLWTKSHAKSVVSAIVFAGTVLGQLFFGVLADRWSRTNSLIVSTVILVVFTALATGSYYKGSVAGMFNILAAWRFFVGIGIGGEYPAGSVGCAESTGEVRSGWRHFVFIMYVVVVLSPLFLATARVWTRRANSSRFTNSIIDIGFVIGAFVPCTIPYPHLFSSPSLLLARC